MARTHYRNGDEISLNGCDGCNPSMINGQFSHESGCPEAWRDIKISCFECGFEFLREGRYQNTCSDCLNPIDEHDLEITDEERWDMVSDELLDSL